MVANPQIFEKKIPLGSNEAVVEDDNGLVLIKAGFGPVKELKGKHPQKNQESIKYQIEQIPDYIKDQVKPVNAGNHCYMIKNQINFEISNEDILQQTHFDVIVNSANSQLRNDGGLSQKLAEKCGP